MVIRYNRVTLNQLPVTEQKKYKRQTKGRRSSSDKNSKSLRHKNRLFLQSLGFKVLK